MCSLDFAWTFDILPVSCTCIYQSRVLIISQHTIHTVNLRDTITRHAVTQLIFCPPFGSLFDQLVLRAGPPAVGLLLLCFAQGGITRAKPAQTCHTAPCGRPSLLTYLLDRFILSVRLSVWFSCHMKGLMQLSISVLSPRFLSYGDLSVKNAHFPCPPLFNPKFEDVPLALDR